MFKCVALTDLFRYCSLCAQIFGRSLTEIPSLCPTYLLARDLALIRLCASLLIECSPRSFGCVPESPTPFHWKTFQKSDRSSSNSQLWTIRRRSTLFEVQAELLTPRNLSSFVLAGQWKSPDSPILGSHTRSRPLVNVRLSSVTFVFIHFLFIFPSGFFYLV